MTLEVPRVSLGLRAQIILALLGVLALTTALALLAVQPLTAASSRQARQRAGMVLARAVAGQVALRSPRAELGPLIEDAVGPGALAAAAVLDSAGGVRAQAGHFARALPRPPYEERVESAGESLVVTVVLPGGGAFVAEASLLPSRSERALPGAVLLYTAVAGAAALFVVFVLLTRYTVRPVEALTRAAERVAAGARAVRAEPRGAREIVRAARAFNVMTEELAARERERAARLEELERATRELRAAQDQLVRSERLAVVGRLAAGIAHEVGNPLAAIVGLTEVLREGGLTEEESRDFAERIGREAQRIHRTVRELLDYARAAPATGDAPGEGGSVGEALAQVVRLLAPQKSMRGVELAEEIDPALPRVRLATDRLVQVLLNLALNAADAARRDRPEAQGARVVLRAAREGDRVAIEVEDNGPGIPPELRQRVFEPFFTTKPAGEGTGLGLAICAVIVEQVGGTVRVLDRADGAPGARLRVELPVSETHDAADSPTRAA